MHLQIGRSCRASARDVNRIAPVLVPRGCDIWVWVPGDTVGRYDAEYATGNIQGVVFGANDGGIPGHQVLRERGAQFIVH